MFLLFLNCNLHVCTGMQRQVKKNIFHQAYWILYTIATVYSFIITICYWTVVHNPGTISFYWLLSYRLRCRPCTHCVVFIHIHFTKLNTFILHSIFTPLRLFIFFFLICFFFVLIEKHYCK